MCSLVHAFITSYLDYCKSLFAQCNISTRQRLQRVQNSAAYLVLNAPPWTPSLPLLQQLHWLPVKARITCKLCLLVYRAIERHRFIYQNCASHAPIHIVNPQPKEILRYYAPTVISRTVHFLSLRQLLETNYLHTFVPLQLCHHFYPDSRLTCTLHHLL